MPTTNNVDVDQDPVQVLGQLIKVNTMLHEASLSPWQKGVKKKLEDLGNSHTDYAVQQLKIHPQDVSSKAGLDPKDFFGKLVNSGLLGGGVQPEGNEDVGANANVLGTLLNKKSNTSDSSNTGGSTTSIVPASNWLGLGGVNKKGQVEDVGSIWKILSFLAKGEVPDTTQKMENLARTQYLKSGGINSQIPGVETLSPEQQMQGWDLARRIGGVRGAKNLMPSIIDQFSKGMTIDQIEDNLRYSQQSPNVSNEWRNAAQSLLVNASPQQSQRDMDFLDDYLSKGDTEGAKSHLKRLAIKNATSDQQNYVMGKERTVDFLTEIQDDLDYLEKKGMGSGFWSGNMENLAAKVGQVKNPELRQVATKVMSAMIQYRRSVTGVQFGQKESEEYQRLFPGINKVGEFNRASINGLKAAFTGDVNKFYEQTMGRDNYNKIFKDGSISSPNKSKEILPGYSSEEWEVVK